ncbi:MAG: hypothetical protein C0483_17440 [Pirellula sp.]|nr:hypothetical protein [Pirellula sp.]
MAFIALAADRATAEKTATASPADPTRAYDFGAVAKGGVGGKKLAVTSLDDDPKSSQRGTLRWAVEQEGPRIVRFRVAGNIRLRAPLEIRNPFITIDGSDAPDFGIWPTEQCFRTPIRNLGPGGWPGSTSRLLRSVELSVSIGNPAGSSHND